MARKPRQDDRPLTKQAVLDYLNNNPGPLDKRALARALSAIETHGNEIGYRDVTHDANVAKVSIIGIGMRAHPGVAKTMFSTLSDKGINIQVISTSEIKVWVLIDEQYVELAVRALHSAYELDAV